MVMSQVLTTHEPVRFTTWDNGEFNYAEGLLQDVVPYHDELTNSKLVSE